MPQGTHPMFVRISMRICCSPFVLKATAGSSTAVSVLKPWYIDPEAQPRLPPGPWRRGSPSADKASTFPLRIGGMPSSGPASTFHLTVLPGLTGRRRDTGCERRVDRRGGRHACPVRGDISARLRQPYAHIARDGGGSGRHPGRARAPGVVCGGPESETLGIVPDFHADQPQQCAKPPGEEVGFDGRGVQ